jgi:hypothetical protein
MSDWPPPGAADPTPGAWPPPSPPSPPASYPPHAAGYPPAWGQPYGPTPGGAPGGTRLPWYRSTAFLILGGLALLVLGGAAGALVTFVATRAAEQVGDAFDSYPAEVTTYGEGGDLAAFALGPGQCASEDVFEAASYGEGSAVPCELRHAVEHYASVEPPTLPDAGGAFDRADLNDFGDRACYLAFQPYVGLNYDDSDFDYATIVPSESAWSSGVRTIHGLLYQYEGGSSAGTAHNSGR